jgi:type IV secretory pathway VirD2 relaxase
VAYQHLRYLDREGTGQTEVREGFFERAQDGIQREEVDAIRAGEPHQFRLIVSPEDAERLDLKDYTRKLMEQVESDLGRKLDWKAINHYNTDNPHTHIVIHGLDRKGEEVFIDREYISNGIRHRAAALATQELGHRLEHEIRDSIQKDIKAKAFTRTDRELLQQAQDNKLTVEVAKDSPAARLQRSQLLGRLQELERFGYAEKLAGQQWRLAGVTGSDAWPNMR